MYDKISSFLSKKSRQRNLYAATLVMFVFLILEKTFSGINFDYLAGNVIMGFSLGITDYISLAVYMAVTVLLAVKVKYKFILIPDSALFAVKLNAVISGIVKLAAIPKIGLITELSIIESVTESFFFALFLCILFAGKLMKNGDRFKRRCPLLCLGALAVCLPATVLFEAVKVFVEEEYYSFPLIVEVFLFIRGVANEMFLDLPYALLVLLMFFVPQKKPEAEKVKITQ